MTDEKMRMPDSFNMGQGFNTVLHALIVHRRSVEEDPEYYNPLGRSTLMGYVIPEWQRPLVWTQEQKIKFLESVWLGMPIGTYTVNVDRHVGGVKDELRNIIVDGQQRLSALEDYFSNKFPVFGLYYEDLNEREMRRLNFIVFPSYETYSNDEAYIREYYNRMNFGGTPHTEDQRA